MSVPNLWKHQEEAINRAKDRNFFALFFEPGCGKTRTAIEILQDVYKRERALLGTLVLAPPIVCPNWVAELSRYASIPSERILLLNGPGAKRLKALEKARKDFGRSFVAITNYEALVSIKGMHEALLRWAPDVMVLDESHKIKTFNSARTKCVHLMADRARYRYLLSGTPVLNSPMDLWAQYRAMDKGRAFGENFYGFRARFFIDKNASMPRDRYFPNYVLRPNVEEDFRKTIDATSLVVKKHECLDLPPLVKKVVNVEMSPEQRKHYVNMRDEFITFIDSEACTAQLAIVKALRLQQIVSGHLPVDDSGDVKAFEKTPREAALKEILEEVLENPEHKVLVWASWRHDYEVIARVCKELGAGFVQVHGEVSAGERDRAIETFRTSPDCKVYIGHPGSGGIGINLIEASYMIYYSRSFNLEHDIQSEARNYRAGSECHNKVTRIDIVAQGTIDEEIQKALANKIKIGDSLLKSLKDTL